jgi:hypothetical protein
MELLGLFGVAELPLLISISHSLANACIYVRLVFGMGGRNSTAGKPVPLYTDIIMTDVDKSTLLIREGVLNRHLYFTAITVMLYVNRGTRLKRRRLVPHHSSGEMMLPFRQCGTAERKVPVPLSAFYSDVSLMAYICLFQYITLMQGSNYTGGTHPSLGHLGRVPDMIKLLLHCNSLH